MATQSLRKKVANKIKELRLRKGLTQEQLAEKAGLHYKYYQKIESGAVNLTLDSIEKLTKAFKCHSGDFFP